MNLAYNYFLYSSIFNAVVITVLGVLVYSKNPKNNVNRLFALFCLAIGEWAYTYIGWPISKTADSALFSFQLLHIGAALVSILYLHFVIEWLGLYTKFNKIILKIGYSFSIFFALNTFNPYYIADMVPRFSMRFWAVPGIMYHFYLVVFFGLFLYASYLLLVNLSKTTGILRKQIQFVLFGMVLTFLGGSTNYFLWYGINIPPYGNLLAASFVMFTAYAILKYRFMDIRVIIRRSAVFTVLVLVITALYAILSYLLSLVFIELIGIQSVILNGIVMAVLVALGFEPLKKGLSEITDSFLFKAEYKPQEVLGEFADKLSSTLNLDELTNFLVKKTSEVFKCTKSSLYLFNEDHKQYIEVAFAGKRSPIQITKIDKKLFANVFGYLKQIGKAKEVIVRDEIKKINEQAKNQTLDLVIKLLDQHEVNLVVPFYVKEELIGILFLGDKKSGDVYSQQDINVLEIIAGQSAVSIQNAGLYEEQKHFTEHLKREVAKATKELRIANIQLRKLDKAKSEFISIASHQLRTPLTVIRGYISMIEQGDFGLVSQKVKEPLDRVYKSTMRIIGLVEDLLNISRIESGRLKYDFGEVDLGDLVKDVCEELEQQAKKKNLEFGCIKPTVKIPKLYLDRAKIREVIMNLTDNAIKYTDSGFVRVKLERDDDHVTFSVSDSGRGLDPDEIPLLFQKFSRAKGVQLMHTEGTGLGLYIAKNIIAKHGGKIWVESPGRGKGSTFYIRFKINNKRLKN